jgi:hypothetical protein
VPSDYTVTYVPPMTVTADNRILCAHCGQPSEQVVVRRRYVESMDGRYIGTVRAGGPLCPTCATLEEP